MNDVNQYILRQILEKPYPNRGNQSDPDDKAIFDLMVKNYNSCMDNTTIESSEPTEALEMVAKLAELFPVEDYSSNETITEADHQPLADAITYLAKNGVPLFGEFWTAPDSQNPVSALSLSPTCKLLKTNQDVTVPFFGINMKSDRTLPVPNVALASLTLKVDDLAEALKPILPTNTTGDAVPQLAKNLLDFMEAWVALLSGISTDEGIALEVCGIIQVDVVLLES